MPLPPLPLCHYPTTTSSSIHAAAVAATTRDIDAKHTIATIPQPPPPDPSKCACIFSNKHAEAPSRANCITTQLQRCYPRSQCCCASKPLAGATSIACTGQTLITSCGCSTSSKWLHQTQLAAAHEYSCCFRSVASTTQHTIRRHQVQGHGAEKFLSSARCALNCPACAALSMPAILQTP